MQRGPRLCGASDLQSQDWPTFAQTALNLFVARKSLINSKTLSTVNSPKRKKTNPLLNSVEFKTVAEGMSIQMLHNGSYDSEPASFKIMEKYASDNNLSRLSKVHREIYLSDPRKTVEEKLRTVLRFKVVKK